jgi:hypothetical protein
MTASIEGSDALRHLATVERRILDAVRIGIGQAVRVAYRAAATSTVFKDRTGELRGRIDIVDTGAFRKRLISRAKHSKWVNSGTQSHVIEPKNGAFLVFKIGGRTIYARKVNHPGTQPRPFMDNAAAAGSQAMKIILDEAVEKAIDAP